MNPSIEKVYVSITWYDGQIVPYLSAYSTNQYFYERYLSQLNQLKYKYNTKEDGNRVKVANKVIDTSQLDNWGDYIFEQFGLMVDTDELVISTSTDKKVSFVSSRAFVSRLLDKGKLLYYNDHMIDSLISKTFNLYNLADYIRPESGPIKEYIMNFVKVVMSAANDTSCVDAVKLVAFCWGWAS